MPQKVGRAGFGGGGVERDAEAAVSDDNAATCLDHCAAKGGTHRKARGHTKYTPAPWVRCRRAQLRGIAAGKEQKLCGLRRSRSSLCQIDTLRTSCLVCTVYPRPPAFNSLSSGNRHLSHGTANHDLQLSMGRLCAPPTPRLALPSRPLSVLPRPPL